MSWINPSDLNFGSPVTVGGASPLSFTTAPALSVPGANLSTLSEGLPGLAPAAPSGGFFGGMGGLDKVNVALSGLQTLGGLWAAFQSAKLAKKTFNFTKDVANTNLANQIQSYNTAIGDRARSRGVMEGQTPDQVAGYISANGLNRNPSTPSGSSLSGITAAALSNYGSYTKPALGH